MRTTVAMAADINDKGITKARARHFIRAVKNNVFNRTALRALLNAGDINGALKVAAAVTAAGAITEKYAGVEETALTKMFKGDVSPPIEPQSALISASRVSPDPRQT